MDFNKKLQELRKQRGLTQEELAEVLFVSRTAVSKWESGRGYPNIDSLKNIAKFFSITVDELLSCEEILTLAKEDTKQKITNLRVLVWGLLDLSVVLFFFLPFFGQNSGENVNEVSLLSLTLTNPNLRIAYLAVVIGTVVFGILTLALQNIKFSLWEQSKSIVSLVLNVVGVFLFIMSSQPYAASMLFAFLIIKVLMLIK